MVFVSNTINYSTVQYSTAQCSAVQYMLYFLGFSTPEQGGKGDVEFSAVQCSAVQCSAV